MSTIFDSNPSTNPNDDLTPTTAAKICPQCGVGFTKASHLLRHTRSHAQEKPFACPSCGRGFARTDALQRHERTVHSAKRKRRTEVSSATTDSFEGEMRASPVTSETSTSTNWLAGTTGETSEVKRREMQDMDEFRYEPFPLMEKPALDPASPSDIFSLPPFLTTFPAPIPPTEMDIEELLGDWLSHEGGASATESALALVFSDQVQSTPRAMSGPSVPVSSSAQFGEWPAVSTTRLNGTRVDEHWKQAGSPVPAPTLQPWQPDNAARSYHYTTAPVPPDLGSMSGFGGTVDSRCIPRAFLTADTWESGISRPHSPRIPNPDNLLASRITSPEQVVGELNVSGGEAGNGEEYSVVIPSMTFLDSCLHLYFRDFHPSFPIIHKSTFQRDRTSPLLLLSMCSIGCMFIGTQAARDKGLRIYERLHYVLVNTRDAKMATETSRIAICISALLGQSFSFLYGQPRQMLTAELYHGTMGSLFRRSGLLGLMTRRPISFDEVDHLTPEGLEQRWRIWARQEMLKRVVLGLTIHAAELSVYSGLPRLIPAQFADEGGFQDLLFEAETAHDWRVQLIRLTPTENLIPHRADFLAETDRLIPSPSQTFLPTVLLAQNVVNIHTLRAIKTTDINLTNRTLSNFYGDMLAMAERYDILSKSPCSRRHAPQKQALCVLWHYACAVRLSPIRLIEEAAGRSGDPANDSFSAIRVWVNTPTARLAMLHSGYILHQASDLSDLAFLIPRAIFQATLLLFCYMSSVNTPAHPGEILDILDVSDWQRLAGLCDMAAADTTCPHTRADLSLTPQERYITYGTSTIKVEGFLDGRENQLDIVRFVEDLRMSTDVIISLRSTSNRLLRRCTPWGIGDMLGNILSTISF